MVCELIYVLLHIYLFIYLYSICVCVMLVNVHSYKRKTVYYFKTLSENPILNLYCANKRIDRWQHYKHILNVLSGICLLYVLIFLLIFITGANNSGVGSIQARSLFRIYILVVLFLFSFVFLLHNKIIFLLFRTLNSAGLELDSFSTLVVLNVN